MDEAAPFPSGRQKMRWCCDYNPDFWVKKRLRSPRPEAPPNLSGLAVIQGALA